MATNCGEQLRVACALGGSCTALAIGKVLPVGHCGPGCIAQYISTLQVFNGGQSAYPFEATVLPSSNFCESDVVFGGADRFKKVIQHSIEYYDADMIVAVDGCTPEIIGDDIESVVSDFEDARIPVIYAKLPGIQGDNLTGHSRVLNAIIDQYLKDSGKRNDKQVNILGVVPFYDPLWEGTLEAIEKTLKAIGLEPNVFYGYQKGLADVDKIPEAAFNLVLSPWVDHDVAKKLETKYGTPYLVYPNIPVGPEDTAKFLRTLQEYADLDKEVVEAYIKEREDRYYHYINKHVPWVHYCNDLAAQFVVIGSVAAAVSVTKFVVNDMGLFPKRIYITENVPKKYQQQIKDHLYDVGLEEKDYEIIFSIDGGLAHDELLNKLPREEETVIFGSIWDQSLALKLGAAYVPVSAPYGDCMVADKTYFGYEGGLALFADVQNAIAKTPWNSLT